MTTLQLFRARGPDEPFMARGLCQSDPAYICGREDFVYGRAYNPRAFFGQAEQYTYSCAWEHERREAAEVRFALRRSH